MKPLTNVWLDTLTEFDDVLDYISINLSTLKENAETADFINPAIRKRYAADVDFMKQFFERAEYLARGEDLGQS